MRFVQVEPAPRGEHAVGWKPGYFPGEAPVLPATALPALDT